MQQVWVANPAVTADRFDGEVVLICISTGLYFSLRGAAAALWAALPVSEPDILGMFGDLPESDRISVQSAWGQLKEHELVVASDGPSQEPTRVAFEAPVVEVYADLAELITLDPVHEVGAKGWPEKHDP